MRILLHDYSGHPFTVQLGRALAARGDEVHYTYSASVNSPHGSLEHLPEDAATFSIHGITSSKSIPKTQFVQRMILERDYGRKLKEHVADVRPDTVICANTPSLGVSPVAKYCAGNRIQFVSWVQDLYGVAAYKILKRKLPGIGHLAGQYLMYLDRQALRSSDSVVCITEDFVVHVLNAGVPREKIHVIHNWAPLKEIPQRPRDNRWSQKSGLSSSIRFLYSGTLAMKHNPRLLLELAQSLATWGTGELIVVSRGPGADWLRENAQKAGIHNLKLFDFQSFEDLPDVLGSADVTTVILERDAGIFSVPSKVLSYFCSARPILAAMPLENLAARTIVASRAGFVTEPDDMKGWLANARRLHDDALLRNEMGASARAYAEATFDTEEIATKFSNILASPQMFSEALTQQPAKTES